MNKRQQKKARRFRQKVCRVSFREPMRSLTTVIFTRAADGTMVPVGYAGMTDNGPVEVTIK